MGIPVTRAIHDRIRMAPPRNVTRYLQIIKLVMAVSMITSPFWLAILLFTNRQEYSFTWSFVFVPLLGIVAGLAITHFTQGDSYLRRLLMVGLLAHIAASSLFLWVGMVVYGGIADAFHYWTVGLQLAERFQIVGWSAFQPPYWSTNLINNLCGIVALLIGDSLPTAFIAFALVSLAGAYLFYRAFTIAFPNGDRWLFGLLVMLLPSLLFWSSFAGKDALIQYFIALTSLGFARLTQRPAARSALICAIGLLGTLLVRAHVASMLAIAMTFPYVVGKSAGRGTSKAARIVLIPVLAGCTYLLINQAGNLLDLDKETTTSVLQEADAITRTSQVGGSAFNEGTSLPIRIAASPFLMFRPFPWEINNAMGLAPAAESAGLLLLCWSRRRQIWSTLHNWRDPFTAFLLMYSAVFLITFSASISNFGILLRQRIMLTPLFLMLLCARRKPEAQEILRGFGKKAWLVSSPGAARSYRVPTGT